MDLVSYFQDMGFKILDLRDKGGAIWVAGSEKQLSSIMIRLKKEHNISFQFCEDSKAIRKHLGGSGSGWWTKDSTSSSVEKATDNAAPRRAPEPGQVKETRPAEEKQAVEKKPNDRPTTRSTPKPEDSKRVSIPDRIAKELEDYFT